MTPVTRSDAGFEGRLQQLAPDLLRTLERVYGAEAAPLVHSLADLAEITERLDLDDVDHYTVRAEFLSLIKAVVREGRVTAGWTELDLDLLTTRIGLDIRRGEIPPLRQRTTLYGTAEPARVPVLVGA